MVCTVQQDPLFHRTGGWPGVSSVSPDWRMAGGDTPRRLRRQARRTRDFLWCESVENDDKDPSELS
ncbi:unnamed protein product [Urochloa humidicola]